MMTFAWCSGLLRTRQIGLSSVISAFLHCADDQVIKRERESSFQRCPSKQLEALECIEVF